MIGLFFVLKGGSINVRYTRKLLHHGKSESGEVEYITLDGRIENFGKYNISNDDFYLEPSQEITNSANVIKDHKFEIDPHKIVLSSEEVKEHKIVYYPMKKITITSSANSSSD